MITPAEPDSLEPLRVAIIGYGLAGRWFHAPLIAATDGLCVRCVLTRDPGRRAEALAEHPSATVISDLEALWQLDDGPQLVVVASANDSHAPIARQAIERGIPVVVDKPLAPNAGLAAELVALARERGVLLSVFQNRRYDTDLLTLRRLIAEGALGDVLRFESRFERWRPHPRPDAWREEHSFKDGGGVLLDLGAHLVDQALLLFGPVRSVYGEVSARRGSPGDDDCFLALTHAGGVISHLSASAVAASAGPRLRVQGSRAGFVVPALDPQEEALRLGRTPANSDQWGMPPSFQYGRLISGEQSVPVTPEPGAWGRFYSQLRDALLDGGEPPVNPQDAVATLRVLEAAQESARCEGVVSLD